jgi:hypothetical protein
MVWKFIYEEPGAPVLQAMLDFNNRSHVIMVKASKYVTLKSLRLGRWRMLRETKKETP